MNLGTVFLIDHNKHLEDDIDINIWSDVEETAVSHDLLLDQDNNNSDG